MCEPTTIAATIGAVATIAQGYQAQQQGKFENKVAKFNARVAENEATQTRNVGIEEENRQRQRTAQLLSRQRTQLAAQGIRLGTGSALDIEEDTLTLGEADALRIRSNFQRQAESLDLGAQLERQRGEAAEAAGRSAFRTSLLKAGSGFLTSGEGVASKWYNPNSAGAPIVEATPTL